MRIAGRAVCSSLAAHSQDRLKPTRNNQQSWWKPSLWWWATRASFIDPENGISQKPRNLRNVCGARSPSLITIFSITLQCIPPPYTASVLSNRCTAIGKSILKTRAAHGFAQRLGATSTRRGSDTGDPLSTGKKWLDGFVGVSGIAGFCVTRPARGRSEGCILS